MVRNMLFNTEMEEEAEQVCVYKDLLRNMLFSTEMEEGREQVCVYVHLYVCVCVTIIDVNCLQGGACHFFFVMVMLWQHHLCFTSHMRASPDMRTTC